VDHFVDILRFWLIQQGFDAEFFVSEYNTIHQTVLDPQSALYAFKPDITVILINHRDINVEGISEVVTWDEMTARIDASLAGTKGLWDAVIEKTDSYVIQCNIALPLYRPMGNLEGSLLGGQQNYLRLFNLRLASFVRPGVTLFDMEYIAGMFGKGRWFDERYWYHSKHAFSLDATGIVACRMAKLVSAIKGQAKKCVVLDLDNTLWGGVIADDGIEGLALGNGPDGEAFVDFQKYLLALKKRGVLLAVCSKNEEETAKIPFLSHPDMQIKLDDIVSFFANWKDKASNIREIAQALNIGLDSLVFIDDNPAERALVRESLPMVLVPEMPADPAEYIAALDREACFEMVSVSDEDRVRSSMYVQNALREDFKQKVSSVAEFLRDLNMEMSVEGIDPGNIQRTAQLINKSNQFHLTTTRYTEAQISALLSSGWQARTFRLKDRFGDNGLISVFLVEPRGRDLFINTWVMSCRVLSRGVEEFIYNEMIDLARKKDCSRLIGEYIPTAKNKLVEGLYGRLGFYKIQDKAGTSLWGFDVNEAAKPKEVFIRKV
jgi:FkbH-like protein